jgi:hypothetical protein
MANKKVSQLTVKSSLALSDIVYIISGGVGFSATLQVLKDTIANASTLAPSSIPASPNSTGTTGTVTWDNNFLYLCVATNKWRRIALSSW